MFTGIIEDVGEIIAIEKEKGNRSYIVKSDLSTQLKIDQSIAHNGVCLTVVDVNSEHYKVTAVKETLERSNLGNLAIGSKVNLERCLRLGDRVDGHLVQGHVDQTAEVKEIEEVEGSWKFVFSHDPGRFFTIEKGSICVDGVSLTVVDSTADSFSVVVIPFTYEHTCFKSLAVGDKVNLEFDVVGKYILKFVKQLKN
ncbi:MAG: riboflavin synthase [Flavobacteriales bacterium]|nr:riboflavin synthase [Flavobacteriales bacterium]